LASILASLTAMAVLLGTAVGASARPPAVVRIPEAGPTDGSVSAIAASSSTRLVGKRFVVTNARGRVLRHGHLKPVAGPTAPWRFAARADLSGLRRPGRYRVLVGRTSSRSFTLDPGFRAHLVTRLLRLFAVNADGREANPVFGPSHLHDATIIDGPHAGQHIDLVGGWRDAGDNLKFTLTVSSAVEALHVAARLDPAHSATYRNASAIGVRYLLKAHPSPDIFIAQVADEADHLTPAVFRRPEGDDSLSAYPTIANRPAYTAIGSGTAGAASAALAAAAQGTTDPAQRAQLLQAAREWYAYGKALAGPGPVLGRYTDPSTGQVSPGFEQPSDWTGWMALAADELTRASGEPSFATDAVTYLQSSTTCIECGLDLSEVGPLPAADLCGALGRAPIADPAVRAVACDKLHTAVNDAKDRARTISAFGTPQVFDFGWVASHSGQGALLATAARAHLGGDARLAAGARDYLLGRNPWGSSFVIGPGPGRAHDPHHPAYLVGSPATLDDGLVVGGPTSPAALRQAGLPPASGPLAKFNSPTSVYEDRRLDYQTSEVGLGYTAFCLLLIAATG
jgi:hypothetical protein